jgi:hypothetical protein
MARFQLRVFDPDVSFAPCRITSRDGPRAEAIVGADMMNQEPPISPLANCLTAQFIFKLLNPPEARPSIIHRTVKK